MSGLGPEARALIDAAEGAANPSPSEAARLHAEFLRRAGPPALTALPASAAAATAKTASVFTAAKLVKALAIVSFVAAAGGGAVHAIRERAPASVSPAVATSALVASAAAPPETPVVPPPEAVALEEPPPRARAKARAGLLASGGARKTESPSGPSLDDELPLIARAQDALASHQPDLALTALREHASRFPHGQLAEERNALRVLAGCAGDGPGARGTAEGFLRAHPHSPLASRIRQECGQK